MNCQHRINDARAMAAFPGRTRCRNSAPVPNLDNTTVAGTAKRSNLHNAPPSRSVDWEKRFPSPSPAPRTSASAPPRMTSPAPRRGGRPAGSRPCAPSRMHCGHLAPPARQGLIRPRQLPRDRLSLRHGCRDAGDPGLRDSQAQAKWEDDDRGVPKTPVREFVREARTATPRLDPASMRLDRRCHEGFVRPDSDRPQSVPSPMVQRRRQPVDRRPPLLRGHGADREFRSRSNGSQWEGGSRPEPRPLPPGPRRARAIASTALAQQPATFSGSPKAGSESQSRPLAPHTWPRANRANTGFRNHSQLTQPSTTVYSCLDGRRDRKRHVQALDPRPEGPRRSRADKRAPAQRLPRQPGRHASGGRRRFRDRVHHGPGYRLYCLREADALVVLCGGDKGSQRRDIERAGDLARQRRQRT